MEKEFTEGDAFVAAYSEYFGVVYKEALKYSGNPSHSRRDCSGCLFHRIYTVWK